MGYYSIEDEFNVRNHSVRGYYLFNITDNCKSDCVSCKSEYTINDYLKTFLESYSLKEKPVIYIICNAKSVEASDEIYGIFIEGTDVIVTDVFKLLERKAVEEEREEASLSEYNAILADLAFMDL